MDRLADHLPLFSFIMLAGLFQRRSFLCCLGLGLVAMRIKQRAGVFCDLCYIHPVAPLMHQL